MRWDRLRVLGGLLSSLLGLAQEQGQAGGGEDDADRIADSLVVLEEGDEAKALASHEEVGAGNSAHEGGGNRADPEVALVLEQEHGAGPQNDHGEGLVGPGEVTPDHVVVDLAEGVAEAEDGADAQDGNAESQTVLPLALVDLEPVGDGQTSGTEGRIAGGDGAGDNAEDREDHTDALHGHGADLEDRAGTAAAELLDGGAAEQRARSGGPDQGDDALWRRRTRSGPDAHSSGSGPSEETGWHGSRRWRRRRP